MLSTLHHQTGGIEFQDEQWSEKGHQNGKANIFLYFEK
jgi:hypothetical protein